MRFSVLLLAAFWAALCQAIPWCPTALRSLAPAAVVSSPPGSPIDLAAKEAWIAQQTNWSGAISEIGAAQKIADRWIQAGVRFPLSATSPYDMGASDRRYGKAGEGFNPRDYTSEARVRRQLLIEYGRAAHAHREMAFAVASSVATHRGNGEAWLGFLGKVTPDSPPAAVYLHVRLRENSTSAQKETLGKLGTNLVYAIHHYRNQPDQFLRSLREGLEPDSIWIDQISAHGAMVGELLRMQPRQWIDAGLTPYVLLQPDGTPIAPQALDAKQASRQLLDPNLPQWEMSDQPIAGKWTLLAADKEVATAAIRSCFVEREGRPKRARSLPLYSEVRDVTDFKLRLMNNLDDLKGTIIEVGPDKPLARRFFSVPFGATLFETEYFRDLPLTESEHEGLGSMVPGEERRRKLLRVLEDHLPWVTYHKPHRKFVLGTLIEGNQSFIGIVVQTKQNGPFHRIVLAFDECRGNQTELTSELAVHALYSLLHGPAETWRNRLTEGFPPGTFGSIRIEER